MREVGKYEAALQVLTGTGIQNDFASVFIVNNKVVSMYAILKKLVDSSQNNSKNGIWIGGSGYKNTFASFASQYRTSRFNKKDEAQSKFYDMLETIYKNKVHIQVNMAKVMAI